MRSAHRISTGALLHVWVFLTGTPLFAFIRRKLLEKNGFIHVLVESAIPDRPTFSPLQPPTIPEASQEAADSTHFQVVTEDDPQARVSHAFTCSTGAYRQSLVRPYLVDNHAPYHRLAQ